MFKFSTGSYLIFSPGLPHHPELLTIFRKNKVRCDIVSDYETLLFRMTGSLPDAILMIVDGDESTALVKEIRSEKIFDQIPILVFPSAERAIANIQSYFGNSL